MRFADTRWLCTVAWIFGILAAVSCTSLRASVSDDAAEFIARKMVSDLEAKKYSHGVARTPDMLRAIRFGDLEDRFLQFQADTAPRQIGKALQIPEPLYVYRLTDEGTFLLPQEKIGPGDMPTMSSVTMDGHFEWIVVVSRRTGESYGLAGFELTGEAEPVAAFNRLIDHFHSTIPDPDVAEELATLFYLTTTDPHDHNLMTNWLELRLRVEKYAYGKFDEKIAARLFSAWWKQFNTSRSRPNVKVTARQDRQGFLVDLPVFRVSENREIAVISRKVRVLPSGICRFESDSVLFQWPMRGPRND